PVFSGPHKQPYFCTLAKFGLTPTGQGGCSARTETDYYYYSSDTDSFVAYTPGEPRPADLAYTMTSTGHRVPFIVRRETGVINRAVYRIALLANPDGSSVDPTHPGPEWNGRLAYRFHGGLSVGHSQGIPSRLKKVLAESLLGQGYAVATA